MKLPNKLYDILKWVLMIAVPAIIALLTTLTTTWEWDIPVEAIVASVSAVATFLGAIVGISNYTYSKSEEDGGK